MARREGAVEGGEEERFAPSSAEVWCKAAPEGLEAPIGPNGVLEELIDHHAEMVQELRPDVRVVAEQNAAEVVDGEILGPTMAWGRLILSCHLRVRLTFRITRGRRPSRESCSWTV